MTGTGMSSGRPSEGFAALGTVAAVVVALWAFMHRNYTRRHAERRQQAELITGWISDHVISGLKQG